MVGNTTEFGYDIPLNQPYQPQQQDYQQQQQGQYQLPELSKDPLAERGQITSDLYNNYGLIKSYIQDMLSKGIDPTVPDYSQPGGGLPFITYHKLEAGVMHATNALKGEFENEKQTRQLELTGKSRLKRGVDRNSLYASNPNNFYSTEPAPFVEEANKRLNTPTYTGRDERNFNQAYLDPNIQRIDQMVQQGMMSPEEGEFQKANLQKNIHQTAYQQLIPRGGSNGKVPPGVSVLKKVVNLSSGVWNDGTHKSVVVDGKVYQANNEMAGESTGQYMYTDDKGKVSYKPKIISRWLKDPETGEVKIQYEDPEIPDETVSNKPGSLATNFIANNPKYGDVAKTMDVAHSMGILDDTGSVIPETLTPDNAEEIKAKVRNSGKAAASRVNARVAKIKDQLSKIENPTLGHNTIGFKLPNGVEIEVGKHKLTSDKFFIENPEDIFDNADKKSVENLSLDDVVKLLSDAGLFENNLTESSGNTYSPTQQKALDAFSKQFGRQPTADELQKILNKFK